MDVAPFEGVPLAPKGATLADFDAYIAETRALLEDRYPRQTITNEMLVVAIQTRARAELDAMEAAGADHDATTDEDLEVEGVIPDNDIINDSLAHGPESQPWHPAGRTNAFGSKQFDPFDAVMAQVRHVPSLKWYQMVVLRERCVNDIVDALEGGGQQLPIGTERSLKKMWLLMDVATTKGRTTMIGNEALWTHADLHNIQFFLTKLSMHFQDPVWADPFMNTLVKLLLGQRTLYKLWLVLTRHGLTELRDIIQLKVRYDYLPVHEQYRRALFGEKVLGVPAHEVGVLHLEAWGRGTGHLQRPDELIRTEAVRRGLDIDRHIIYMILWGQKSIPEDDFLDEDELPDADILETTTWAELSQPQRADLLQENLDTFRSERQFLFARQARLGRIARINTAVQADMVGGGGSASSAPAINPDDGIDFSALPTEDDPSTWTRTVVSPEPDSGALRGSEPTLTEAMRDAMRRTDRVDGAQSDDDVRLYIYGVLFGSGLADEDQEIRADKAWVDWEREDSDPRWLEYVDEINAPDDESFEQFDDLELYERQEETHGEGEDDSTAPTLYPELTDDGDVDWNLYDDLSSSNTPPEV
ncbi:conserved hypothetical protein [Verticillium alfalfae VaMs.102]|uniref:Uncharacterized protein n=1 Tax=Verticillium alfalfae (strain VaMs.102 / ATCC MYA-4576 / FGSC 10136) TaxID=526221 RepID=C9SFV4_VERA1|nr:conserved hypothetical protein [Verticillium alfalfae VaMs.102]EEY18049.1 conserved hypothetical protein [Verticillium alfalfae VaMs.102]